MFTSHFDYLYVEPTSHCALKCPRCPRTFSPQSYTPTHLSIEIFQSFIGHSKWETLKTIEYGGNFGDPIYHPRIREFLLEARSRFPTISQILHTNGSHSPQWWEKTTNVLNERDMVLFSIDGLETTNSIYRKGSNWQWIQSAVQCVARKQRVIWKFIIFKHNQHQILEAIKKAQEWGVDTFLLVKSHSFYGMWERDGRDELAPDFDWARGGQTRPSVESISPRCTSQSMHYLSASGHYSPCCWMNFEKDYSIELNADAKNSNDLQAPWNANKLQFLKESWSRLEPQTCKAKCGTRPGLESRSSHDRLEISLQEDAEDWSQQVDLFLGPKN